MKHCVKVRVPATTANCGPGFDAVGIACTLYNTFELNLCDDIIINIYGEGQESLPCDENNVVVQAIQRVFNCTGLQAGFKLTMHNNIPLSRGLGSSAAAVVGGLCAANAICGDKLSKSELLAIATEFEGHPDNVAPAIFGGITLSFVDGNKANTLRFIPPLDLKMVACIPDFTLATKLARQALPKTVPHTDAVFNVSRTALLVGALAQGQFEYLRFALKDRLHQPYREKLIPGMKDVFDAAVSAGALGAVISGAGSTLMAFTVREAVNIGEQMVKAFANNAIAARYIVLDIDKTGVQIM